MIVEPVPTDPRSPLRRSLRAGALALPLVLLVGVVAAGALGPEPPAPAERPSADATPLADTRLAATPDPDATRAPAVVLNGRPIDFPTTWIGLRVHSVSELREERQAGAAEGIVAVAGYLSYDSVDPSCMDAYLEADRGECVGRTLLAETTALPDSRVGGGFAAVGPHLHPVFPPPARAPRPARADQPDSPRRSPIPVVVLGRFTEPPGAACATGERHCGEAFAVERVVWVAGSPWNPILTIDPAMGVEPNIPEMRRTVEDAAEALGRGSYALATSVVRPDLLATVDPEAAAALPAVPEGRRLSPVTYARGLVFQFDASQPLYGRDPVVGWVVLDSISGELLARGGPRSEPVLAESP
jgi:hypothetical protein